MTVFEIIILSIVQGITEFLPISSSAHLILPSQLLGWTNQGLAFDVAVHVGSLAAVVIYLREDIARLSNGWLRTGFSRRPNQAAVLSWLIVLATIPAIGFGLLLKDAIEMYARDVLVIAGTTIIFGVLLLLADRHSQRNEEVTNTKNKSLHALNWRDAGLIGLAQAVALIPGTSRSGITMTAALFLNYSRESAARFSFLLSIPVILGAGTLATYDLMKQPQLIDWAALLLGTGLSFVAAYACIYLFMSWISRIGMLPFVVYRLVLGLFLLWFGLN